MRLNRKNQLGKSKKTKIKSSVHNNKFSKNSFFLFYQFEVCSVLKTLNTIQGLTGVRNHATQLEITQAHGNLKLFLIISLIFYHA